ncbi:MAG: Gfo/Idh/MocA family oxidoreductase [Oscillospiraceae bacterium]
MLNFAILTAGNIAAQMANTVKHMNSELHPYAIAARDKARASALALNNGFEKAYGSYDELFCDDKVDIIYIGSTHEMHYAHAKAALLHGKHVLCEKPLTTSAPLAEELFALAASKNLVIMDATWTRYMPFVKMLQSVLDSGDIGAPCTLSASFGFPLTHVERMSSPVHAGGALLDLGIYPLTFAAIAFGSDFESVHGECTKSDVGVDLYNAITVKWKNGRIGTLTSNMQAELPNLALIHGTNGHIEVPEFWHANMFTVYTNGKEPCIYDFPHEFTGYEYEVRELIHLIDANKFESALLPHAETLRILKVMDTLRNAWQIKYPFE